MDSRLRKLRHTARKEIIALTNATTRRITGLDAKKDATEICKRVRFIVLAIDSMTTKNYISKPEKDEILNALQHREPLNFNYCDLIINKDRARREQRERNQAVNH